MIGSTKKKRLIMKTKSFKKNGLLFWVVVGWANLSPFPESCFKEVYGSSTSAEKLVALQSEGIRAFQVSIQDEALVLDPAFLEVSTLIIAVPFGAQKKETKGFCSPSKTNCQFKHTAYHLCQFHRYLRQWKRPCHRIGNLS